jgi:hypothetical protein
MSLRFRHILTVSIVISYANVTTYVKLDNLRNRRHDLDGLLVTQAYLGFKFRPCSEIVGLRVSLKLFSVQCRFFKCENRPSAGYIRAANVVCTDTDMLKRKPVPINHVS